MKTPWPPFEELLRGLGDPDRHARCRAAQGLGEGRDPRAVEPLLRALADRAGDVRAKAAVALGRLRDPRAIGPLIEAMRDDKVSVRDGATAAVKKFGKRAYGPLLDAYRGASGDFRLSLIRALAHYKTPEVSELLIAALDSPGPVMHLELVRLLARRKERRAVERILAGLGEARPGLERAVRAWDEAEIDDVQAFERVQAESSRWAESAQRVDGYIRALGEIGDARAFGPMEELLEIDALSMQPMVVPAIVAALRKIDNARAVDLLHRRLDEPSSPQRDRLEMMLAGMDLMNATQSLRASAAGGNLGVLWQALREAGAAMEELHSRGAGIEDTSGEEEDVSRTGTELMRRLEEVLRGLARGDEGG